MIKVLMKYSVVLLVMLGGCNADLHTKEWAVRNLKERQPITVIQNLLEFGFAQNRGMVFGLFNGEIPDSLQNALVIFRLLILLLLTVFIWWKRNASFLFLFPFLLFWAGGVGNLIDFTTKGYVVDWIHIRAGHIIHWPFYFNLADAYVTIGIILLIGYELMYTSSKCKTTNANVVDN